MRIEEVKIESQKPHKSSGFKLRLEDIKKENQDAAPFTLGRQEDIHNIEE